MESFRPPHDSFQLENQSSQVSIVLCLLFVLSFDVWFLIIQLTGSCFILVSTLLVVLFLLVALLVVLSFLFVLSFVLSLCSTLSVVLIFASFNANCIMFRISAITCVICVSTLPIILYFLVALSTVLCFLGVLPTASSLLTASQLSYVSKLRNPLSYVIICQVCTPSGVTYWHMATNWRFHVVQYVQLSAHALVGWPTGYFSPQSQWY